MTVAGLFRPYKMPRGALPVRCHVLSDAKAQHLEDFLVRQLPQCYMRTDHLRERILATGLPAADILSSKLPDRGDLPPISGPVLE